MVTFAEFMDELQRMLYTLYAYVSIKSNIFIFWNGGTKKTYEEKWHFNGEPIEVVDHFFYLGIVLNYNGN